MSHLCDTSCSKCDYLFVLPLANFRVLDLSTFLGSIKLASVLHIHTLDLILRG